MAAGADRGPDDMAITPRTESEHVIPERFPFFLFHLVMLVIRRDLRGCMESMCPVHGTHNVAFRMGISIKGCAMARLIG
jgi:hypothetical protein